ncbi:hypothetical protein Syun_009137 [Stephania yunnanensis]|uniref:Uncharacterized protein n=1 Tax=Stephania yunnanensis TaxID=152371 RepID=A0AAP0KFL8_9MAGN
MSQLTFCAIALFLLSLAAGDPSSAAWAAVLPTRHCHANSSTYCCRETPLLAPVPPPILLYSVSVAHSDIRIRRANLPNSRFLRQNPVKSRGRTSSCAQSAGVTDTLYHELS